MKRDMELVRKILFKIENDYESTLLLAPPIEGYDLIVVAEHCRMLWECGLISEYKPLGAFGAPVVTFWVGNLTWSGYDFLEKIRADTVWNKTKAVVTEKGLPMVLDVIKDVSSAVITSMTEGVIRAIKNG